MKKTKIQIILVFKQFKYIFEVALKLLSNPKPYYESPSNTTTSNSSPRTESYTYMSPDTNPVTS